MTLAEAIAKLATLSYEQLGQMFTLTEGRTGEAAALRPYITEAMRNHPMRPAGLSQLDDYASRGWS